MMNVVKKGGRGSWEAGFQGEYALKHPTQDALKIYQRALEQADYLDSHAWCFTPSSFRLLLHDLFALGLITFREVAFFPTAGCEFFVTLCREGAPPALDRLEMLRQIKAELSVDD